MHESNFLRAWKDFTLLEVMIITAVTVGPRNGAPMKIGKDFEMLLP
jgi:hypothetical protein